MGEDGEDLDLDLDLCLCFIRDDGGERGGLPPLEEMGSSTDCLCRRRCVEDFRFNMDLA